MAYEGGPFLRIVRHLVEETILLLVILGLSNVVERAIEWHLHGEDATGFIHTVLVTVRIGSALVVVVLFVIHAMQAVVAYYRFSRRS